MKKLAFAVLVAGLATSAAVPASAVTTYRFALSGPQTASWTLPASPNPSITVPPLFFVMVGVSGTVNGSPDTFSLGFGSALYNLNFGLLSPSNGQSASTTGPILFTGPVSAPTFKLGTFALSDGYSLSIAGVPESASWAMMIGGMGILGGALRVKRRAGAAVA